MNLYLVSRTDEVDWDEWREFVVAADSENQALRFAREKQNYGEYKVEQLDLKTLKPGIILGDFVAG